MEKLGEEIHMDETEASGGSKEGVVRWMLVIGLVLAIALLSVIWMTGAFTYNGYGAPSEADKEAAAANAAAAATDAGMDTVESMPQGKEELQDDLEVIEN